MSWDDEEGTDNKWDFKWGKLKEKSPNNVDLYESFTFGGVEYFLYDCVYLQPIVDSEVPYIGKIVKIMDHPSYRRKVKIIWFFRPSELSNWLRIREITYLVHEIFLASGKGLGVANINPVEAIVGKCNVICTSEDKRNPQPSKQELSMADFVFSCTFDVHECTFSDQLDNNISEIAVEHFFNNNEYSKLSRYQESKEVENPKSSGSDKDKIKAATIVQTKEKPKLKPVEGVVYHSGSFQSGSFEDNFRLGDSRKPHSLSSHPLQGGEVTVNAARARKPRMRCKDAAMIHLRHDQPVDLDRIKANPELAQGNDMQHMKTKVTATESFEPANGGILSSANLNKITKFTDKEVASKPVPKKFTTADTYYLKMKKSLNTQFVGIKEPRKDSIQHDEGIFNPVTPSRRPTIFLDREVAPEKDSARHDQLAEKSRADIQHPNMKKPDLIERRETVRAKDLGGHYREITSTVNLGNKATRIPNEEAPEASQLKRMFSSSSLTSETQQKEDIDRSKWFKPLTWEQRMDRACEKGTLIRLQNLDPSYASAEIEDTIWTYLNVRCTAKVLQQSALSSPHNGQALLIFETEEQAEMVISELRSRCLMLPNGRPLIAQRGVPRILPDKSATVIGHLSVNKMNKSREQTKAVSTSHCAQPNTIEYELALDWILMQKRSETCLQALYEGHGKELAALKAKLKQ
ncbi:hypothetical protein MKX01_009466 [Papaver californicum]|nr:hypothetical protein MKX01_009466 [Papaver californicum]